MDNFMSKFSHFCYYGNKGHSRVNVSGIIKLHNQENCLIGVKFWRYLLFKPSCSEFCVKIYKFSSPW